MVKGKRTGGSLTADEQPIVKALLNRGWAGQDIQNLVNIGRASTVNSGRITKVKQSDIAPASDGEVETFLYKKRTFDQETGLNLIDDERLVKAREAMCLAVYIFNTPHIRFKAEAFSVYANIAWTYLVHERCERTGIAYTSDDGRTHALSHLLETGKVTASKGIKQNLAALKEIRDAVEHRRAGRSDPMWYSIFQACCLNFDKTMVEWFGERVSLQSSLTFALQFARLGIPQIDAIQSYGVPAHIDALDARLNRDLSEDMESDVEYRMKVVYTLTGSTKGQANVRFVKPGPEGAEEFYNNVLVQERLKEDTHVFRASEVATRVQYGAKQKFNNRDHCNAYLKYKIRPRNNDKKPENTDKKFCVYNKALKQYTYTQRWIDFLIQKIAAGELETQPLS